MGSLAVAKKKPEIGRKKSGPKPSEEGPRPAMLAMKCRQPYKDWAIEFATEQRVSPASLMDLALLEYAKLRGFKLPPQR